MGTSGKRSVAVVVIALLMITGLGAVLAAQLMEGVAPGMPGLSQVCSPLLVPGSAAASAPAAYVQTGPISQQQIELLLLQLDEAWSKADWNRCIEILTMLVAVQPTHAQLHDRLYQAYVNLGWQLLVSQKFQDAHTQFTLALQIKTDGAEALEGLRIVQQFVVGVTPADTAAPAVVCPTAEPVVVLEPAVAVCPAPAIEVPSGFVLHVVQRGDTLFSLARRYGTTVEAIMAANRLVKTTIFVCQQLLIPACTAQVVCPPPASVAVCPPQPSSVVICPEPPPPIVVAVCPPPLVCVPACPPPPPVCVPVCPPPPPPPVCVPVCPPPPVVTVPVCPQPCPPVCVPVCPPGPVRTHVVRRGDTLFRLALAFDTSVSLLMKANGLQTTQLKAGQTLIIP